MQNKHSFPYRLLEASSDVIEITSLHSLIIILGFCWTTKHQTR